MSFKSKVDYFGRAVTGKVSIISSDDGASASLAEVMGQNGSIIAHEVYGTTSAPSGEFEICDDIEFEGTNAIHLGAVSTSDNKKFALLKFNIETQAGVPPKVSVSGEQVESTATTRAYFAAPEFDVSRDHVAQILDSAFTLSGTGCHLTAAKYNCSCSISKAQVNGDCIAFDVNSGKVEVEVTIRQCGDTAPTLTAGSNYTIVSPLAESNPDSDFPTYSAKLVRYISKTELSSGS